MAHLGEYKLSDKKHNCETKLVTIRNDSAKNLGGQVS